MNKNAVKFLLNILLGVAFVFLAECGIAIAIWAWPIKVLSGGFIFASVCLAAIAYEIFRHGVDGINKL